MQLRYYLTILKRFWIGIVALPLLVGVLSLGAGMQQPQRYGASARVMISQTPLIPVQPDTLADVDLNYHHSWMASEFILDDIPQVVSSRVFAQDVSTLLAAHQIAVPPEVVQAGLRAEKFHRAVTIHSNAETPALAVALVDGAVAALQANGLKYWNRAPAEGTGLSVAVLDPVRAVGPLHSTRQLIINVGMRVGLALAAAVGLAFLLHYLDTTIRDERQAEEWLGVQVLGVIPEEKT